jgi:hypothetical protein
LQNYRPQSLASVINGPICRFFKSIVFVLDVYAITSWFSQH